MQGDELAMALAMRPLARGAVGLALRILDLTCCLGLMDRHIVQVRAPAQQPAADIRSNTVQKYELVMAE